MDFLYSTDFWVAVAFVLFFVIVWWAGAFGAIANALDSRSARIRQELDEARKLREEAQQLLAEYQRKRKEAEEEAEAIVAAATREAESTVVEAKQKTEEFVDRRNALDEQQIAQD